MGRRYGTGHKRQGQSEYDRNGNGEGHITASVLAVSIMEGQIVIKNAYIADYLLKGYTRRVNIKTAAAEGSTNSASCSDGSHSP